LELQGLLTLERLDESMEQVVNTVNFEVELSHGPFFHSVHVTHTPNVGKRGKEVAIFTYMFDGKPDEAESFFTFAKDFLATTDGVDALRVASDVATEYGVSNIYENFKKGVHVTLRSDAIAIDEPRFHISSTGTQFHIRDKEDQLNLPTAIQLHGDKTSPKVLHKWLKTHREELRNLGFDDVLRTLRGIKVKYHYYCAMD
jgi:hypothetical protein